MAEVSDPRVQNVQGIEYALMFVSLMESLLCLPTLSVPMYPKTRRSRVEFILLCAFAVVRVCLLYPTGDD